MTEVSPVAPSGYVPGQQFVVYGGGATGQPQVYFQSVREPQPSPPKDFRLRPSHKALGIVQIVAGIICFMLEFIGFFVGPLEGLFGVGIWAGVFFILPGLLGLLAAVRKNRCLLVSCMVMNIIGAMVAVIGLSMSCVEMIIRSFNRRGDSEVQKSYQLAKESLNIFICVFEIVVTVVHASFTCASCCQCCLPSESQATNVPTAVFLQQPGPMFAPNAAPMQMQYQSGANPVFFVNAGANTSAAPVPVMSYPSAVGGGEAWGQNRGSFPPSYSER